MLDGSGCQLALIVRLQRLRIGDLLILDQLVAPRFVVGVLLGRSKDILRIFQGGQQFRFRETAEPQFFLRAEFFRDTPLQDGSQGFFMQSAPRQERDLVHGDGAPANPDIFSGRGGTRLLGHIRSGGAIARAGRKSTTAKRAILEGIINFIRFS